VESMGAAALILRSRYDIRGAFLSLSMALRLVAIVAGTQHGMRDTVFAVVAAQAVTTASISGIGFAALRRFPPAAPVPLGEDRRPVLSFVLQSSIGTGLVSLRGWIAPLVMGIVRNPTAVGYFRAGQAPQQGFASLSAPVRLILLTEQTREWEKGRSAHVFSQ